MAAVRKGYVDTDAGQIHYRHVAAAGGTPAVFLHQTASSSQMWLKQFDRLDGTRPLWAFDTPGFGGSFDPTDAQPMSQYGDWLAAAIRAAGISRCHLVGHHTGACIAAEIATRQPDLVQSITFMGPVPLTAEERNEFSKHFGTPFTPTPSGGYLLDNWEYIRNLGGPADIALWHREMTDQMRAWQGRVFSYKAVWTQDFTAHYQAIKAPMMILCGTDDVLYPFFGRAKEMRPDAVAVETKGANFEPDLDPDTVAEALKSFFGKNG